VTRGHVRQLLDEPQRSDLIEALFAPTFKVERAIFGSTHGGGFREIIGDSGITAADEVKRVLLTSGKIYYELMEQREKLGVNNIAIVRVEQYYPFPSGELQDVLMRYPVTAEICWVQEDVKKLVAYSSVAHLGFCMLGMFAFNQLGLQGSILYMINHGLSTGALFLCIGMIYERYHTKDMDQLGGLFKRMPVWSFFMVFFTLASLGLPGLNGFIGEFLCLMGCFTAEAKSVGGYPGLLGPWYALVAASVGRPESECACECP